MTDEVAEAFALAHGAKTGHQLGRVQPGEPWYCQDCPYSTEDILL